MKLDDVWIVEAKNGNSNKVVDWVAYDNKTEAINHAINYRHDIYEVYVLHNGELVFALGLDEELAETLHKEGVEILG